MKMRELDRGSVLKSHTFVPSEDDPVGPIGDFLRRVPRSLPADTEAVIYRPAKSAMTSGRAGLRRWILEFKPRSPPFIEPLMGWTGGTDPLPQVRLSFPSREAAIAYAWRQGLRFTVREPHEHRPAARSYADNFPAKPADPILLAAWDRPHLVTPNLDDALVDPSRVFDGPREVAEHPLLIEHEKREVLRHWLWDALLIEAAAAEGMPDGGEPSRLDEVLDALARLDAPAARPQAAADSAPRPRVPSEINPLRRSHSSSPISSRDAVRKLTASQPSLEVQLWNDCLQKGGASGSAEEPIGERT
jgi:hypothetical protein